MPFLLLALISFCYASLTEPHVKWARKNIDVCFGTSADFGSTSLSQETRSYKISPSDLLLFTDAQKNVIQNIVNTEFTEARTGIHFVGWRDCSESPKSDVVLFRAERSDLPEGSASLANGITRGVNNLSYPVAVEKNPSELKRFVLLKTHRNQKILKMVTDNESLSITTLHEFGHIAGLRHEHADRDNAALDKNCIRQGFISNDGLSTTTLRTSTYDPNSIMSYCFMLHRVRKETGLNFKAWSETSKLFLTDKTLYTQIGRRFEVRIGLSKKDLHALKCLYLFDPEKIKNTSHQYAPSESVSSERYFKKSS